MRNNWSGPIGPWLKEFVPQTTYDYLASEKAVPILEQLKTIHSKRKELSMQLKKPAVAGTTESSDIHIMIRPNEGKGIEINLNSVVKAQFGDCHS